MLETGGGCNLLQETLGAERGGELRAQDLDRYQPVVPEVAGEINRSHSALPELALERVAFPKCLFQHAISLGHLGRYVKRCQLPLQPCVHRAQPSQAGPIDVAPSPRHGGQVVVTHQAGERHGGGDFVSGGQRKTHILETVT